MTSDARMDDPIRCIPSRRSSPVLRAAILGLLMLAPVAGAQNGGVDGSRSDSGRMLDRESRVTPVVRVVQKCAPAVVHIRTEVPVTRQNILGFGFPDNATSMGSGVVVDSEGYVVTNEHVIRGARKIEVFLNSDKGDERPYAGELINADPEHDLALLRIRRRAEETQEPFPSVEIGLPDDLMIGETVVAIGNPTGKLADTVTSGVLSAVGREITIEGRTFRGLIQTDAAINPGNSGGPLLNTNGELIGINNAIANAQGIGFAIPASQVRAALDERLLNVDRTRRFWIGMRVEDRPDGVFVKSVDAGGPAALVGIQRDERILSVNGKPVSKQLDYSKAVLNANPGDRLRLMLESSEVKREAELKLLAYDDRMLWERLGLALEEIRGDDTLDRRIRTALGASEREPRTDTHAAWLRITRVKPRGPADVTRLTPGDVLLGYWTKVRVRRGWNIELQDADVPLDSKSSVAKLVEGLPSDPRQRILKVIVAREEELLEGEVSVSR